MSDLPPSGVGPHESVVDSEGEGEGAETTDAAQGNAAAAGAEHRPAEGDADAEDANAGEYDYMDAAAIEARRQQEASEILPGGDPLTSATWPNKFKPYREHLKAELLKRLPSVKCSNYNWQRLYDALLAHGPRVPGDDAAGAAPGDDVPRAQGRGEETEQNPRQRWHSRSCLIRLLHVVVATREAFLVRNELPATRQEMEAGARDSYWREAAEMFNDDEFNPPIFRSRDDPNVNSVFHTAGLSPKHAGYVAEASKLKEEFGRMRTLYVQAMSKFRASGMGDCPEAEKLDRSHTVYSSTFDTFCGDNVALLYWYVLFMAYNCLASAGVDMPVGTTHSSDAQSSNTSAHTPLPRNTQGRGGSRQAGMQAALIAAMQVPLNLHLAQSSEQESASHWAKRVSELQAVKLGNDQNRALRVDYAEMEAKLADRRVQYNKYEEEGDAQGMAEMLRSYTFYEGQLEHLKGEMKSLKRRLDAPEPVFHSPAPRTQHQAGSSSADAARDSGWDFRNAGDDSEFGGQDEEEGEEMRDDGEEGW